MAGVFRTQSSYTHTATGPVLSSPFYRWGHRWLSCETDQGFNPGLAGSKARHHDTLFAGTSNQLEAGFKTGFKFEILFSSGSQSFKDLVSPSVNWILIPGTRLTPRAGKRLR